MLFKPFCADIVLRNADVLFNLCNNHLFTAAPYTCLKQILDNDIYV